MNSVQMHLALTHVPVILSFVGLVMLVVALLMKNVTLTKTSYIILLLAGVAALPVFLTGEGTEEVIERLPGVSEAVIEKHEDMAKLATISITAAGFVAMIALFIYKWAVAARLAKVLVLLLAVTSGGLMAQTAHLGGQIRHTEIRDGVALQNDKGTSGENAAGGIQQQQKDDD